MSVKTESRTEREQSEREPHGSLAAKTRVPNLRFSQRACSCGRVHAVPCGPHPPFDDLCRYARYSSIIGFTSKMTGCSFNRGMFLAQSPLILSSLLPTSESRVANPGWHPSVPSSLYPSYSQRN